MLLMFEDLEQFLKFSNECSEHRYRLFYNLKDDSYILRPSKTSKGLDTAIFKGIIEENKINILENKYGIINISDLIISKD